MAKASSAKNTRLFIIMGFVFVIVIGSGIAAYFIAPKFLGKSDAKQASEKTEESAQEKIVKEASEPEKKEERITVSMKPLVVNIQGSGGRFLKVKMDMEAENKGTAKEIEERMAQIRDNLITILTEKRASEISTLEGKRKLKQEIIRHSNRVLKSGRIKKVYFTDFVMQ